MTFLYIRLTPTSLPSRLWYYHTSGGLIWTVRQNPPLHEPPLCPKTVLTALVSIFKHISTQTCKSLNVGRRSVMLYYGLAVSLVPSAPSVNPLECCMLADALSFMVNQATCCNDIVIKEKVGLRWITSAYQRNEFLTCKFGVEECLDILTTQSCSYLCFFIQFGRGIVTNFTWDSLFV